MTANKEESKAELKPVDMSMMAQLKSQMEVSASIEKAAIEASKPKNSDLDERAKIAEDKAKALENENSQLKLIVGELKSQVKRLGGEVEAQKQETKKAQISKAKQAH